MQTRTLLALILGVTTAVWSTALWTTSQAQQPAAEVAIDADDIGGVVNGPKGPEAGVWVIAETRDLPVRYIKSVVTDDRGRFVVPDLPQANYQVWARGYGLVDSAKSNSRPGQRLTIAAVPAPNEAAAAHYYPAIYWYSMLKIPAADQFGGKNSSIPARLTQTQWLAAMKNTGCVGCHQLGQLSTRTIPPSLGTFASSAEAWKRRVQSGQAGQMMLGQLNGLGDLSVRQLRRLDRSHRQGRAAVRQAAAAAGRRAQHRRHAARLDEREAVPARPDLQRPAQSDGQRLRPALRIAGVQLGHDPDPRPGEERRHHVRGAGARPRDAAQPRTRARGGARRRCSRRPTGAASASGRRASTTTTRCSIGRAASGWPPSVRGAENPAFCRARARLIRRRGVPAGARGPAPGGARSEDREVHLRRHVLLHASPAVRLRRQRHAVDQRRRSGGRLAEHEDVPRDRRRREVAGLDGARPRHQRQRPARRLRRAEQPRRIRRRTRASTRRSTR